MKKFLFIFSGLILLILITSYGFLSYMGFFNKVECTQQTAGNWLVVGKHIVGPYAQIPQVMDELNETLTNYAINIEDGFGQYFDNPKVGPQDSCRSYVGFTVKALDGQMRGKLEGLGYVITFIPQADCVIGEFPIKNSLSYMVGPMVVYPQLHLCCDIDSTNHQTKMIEIYNNQTNKILFVAYNVKLKPELSNSKIN